MGGGGLTPSPAGSVLSHPWLGDMVSFAFLWSCHFISSTLAPIHSPHLSPSLHRTFGNSQLPSAAVTMGTIAKMKICRRLRKDAKDAEAANVSNVAHEERLAQVQVSNECARIYMDLAVSHRIEVCDTPAPSIIDLGNYLTELAHKGVRFHGGRNLETTGGHVYVVFEDLRDASWALVALESQLVRLCEICALNQTLET
ncbi:meiosis mei2 [Fusarium sp. NRRL 52700]|nr:meiosis mei2 [Fusarium sp. NRRL 52700]